MKDDQHSELHLTVTESEAREFRRLDRYLTSKLPELSRTRLKELFEKRRISSKTSLELKKMPPPGTEITVSFPAKSAEKNIAENIPLDILYEDDDLLVINKPAGLVVHPGAGNLSGTLVNAVLYHTPSIRNVGDPERPGIVHRLDKGTSGVMVVAKTQSSHKKLVQTFSEHNLQRKYVALCASKKLPAGGTLKSTLGRHPKHRLKMKANVKGGKEAIGHFRVLSSRSELGLHAVEWILETGRTHQIRVHASELLKAPILCDPLYGNPSRGLSKLKGDYPDLYEKLRNYDHPLLHAQSLSFDHPETGNRMTFTKRPPEIFEEIAIQTGISLEIEGPSS